MSLYKTLYSTLDNDKISIL